MKKFLLLLLVLLILTSCYTNGDCTTAVKEAYPDNEIYRVDVNRFILIDSILVIHCKDCPAPMPKEIHPLLKSMHGEEHRANITNILPTEIRGQFIINDEIIKKE